MRIGTRQIGPDEPVYIIAEIGVNHDGDVERALELVDAAADAGADAIKLQYFKTDLLMSRAAKLAAYQHASGEQDPVAMLRRLELDLDEMARVVDRAHERGIHAIVTIFSTELVAPAMTLPWDALKSASPDIIHRPLLEALMATDKPMIVSTGASTREEVRRAARWLSRASDLVFLQCVSCYPTENKDAHLHMVQDLRLQTGDRPTGYSDHTRGLGVAKMAHPPLFSLLEKHLTYSVDACGPDHAASLTPELFAKYVEVSRNPDSRPDLLDASLLGEHTKRVLACERDVRAISRQSVVVTRDLPAGHTLGLGDLTIKRPGIGIEPFLLDEIVGCTLAVDVQNDTPIVREDLSG